MSKLSAHPGIVVGVDGSPASKVAVQWAARDAELRKVPLTLVHVVRATAGTWLETPLLPEWMRGQRERGRQVIDDALKIVDESCQRGPAQVHCEMPSANAVPALVDLSKNADSGRGGPPWYRHVAGPSYGFGDLRAGLSRALSGRGHP